MINGSCLCGDIRLEFDENGILLFNLCHCSRCQKRSGSAHTSQLQVAGQSFRWLQGTDKMSLYQPSPSTVPGNFCTHCGTRLPSSADWSKLVAVPVGLLDDDISLTPEINIHAESAANWHHVDESMTTIAGQGSDEFWAEFMQKKAGKT